jgi:hypothetical protein
MSGDIPSNRHFEQKSLAGGFHISRIFALSLSPLGRLHRVLENTNLVV